MTCLCAHVTDLQHCRVAVQHLIAGSGGERASAKLDPQVGV